jgi:hypothetical protein
MMFDAVGKKDSVFRHVVYPLAFQVRGPVFQWHKTMHLVEDTDGSILTSVAWDRYLPTTDYVHAYGCRLALRMNKNLREKNKFRENDRRIYTGAYQIFADRIRALAGAGGPEDVISADVSHNIETGEIAHTDLRIMLRGDPKFDLEGTKTEILVWLWNNCNGPLVPKYGYDKDLQNHSGADLPPAPSGPYRDSRSHLARAWCLIRFRLLSWLKRKAVLTS